MVAPVPKFEVGKTYETATCGYKVKIVATYLDKLIGEARFTSRKDNEAPNFIFVYNQHGKILAHWNEVQSITTEVVASGNLQLVFPKPPKPPIKGIRVHPKTGTSDEARHNLDTFLHSFNKGYVGIMINDPEVGTEDVFYSYDELKSTKYWSIIK